MTKRRKVDASKVIEAVEKGHLSKDVMNSFGLETPSAKSQRKDAEARKRRKEENQGDIVELGVTLTDIEINKRGSLVLPRSLVEKLGFRLGDCFIARKTKAGIILKPVL